MLQHVITFMACPASNRGRTGSFSLYFYLHFLARKYNKKMKKIVSKNTPKHKNTNPKNAGKKCRVNFPAFFVCAEF